MILHPRFLCYRLSLIFPLVLNFVIGGWVLWEISNLVYATNSVTYSHRTMMAISQVEGSMSQAESALRGFLLTEKEEFLVSYLRESQKVLPALAQLEAIVQDEPFQKERILEAQNLVHSWLTFGENVTTETSSKEEGANWVSSGREVLFKDEVLNQLKQVKDAEALSHLQKSEIAKTVSTRAFSIGILAFVILALWMTLALRKMAQQERNLRKSENRFRSLFENAYEAIVVVDQEGIIYMANQKAKPQLGYWPEELVGQPFETIIPAAHLKTQLFPLDEENETLVKRKDGSAFLASISLGLAGTGDKPLIIANIRDISEKKKAEERSLFTVQFTETIQQSLDIQQTLDQIVHLCTPTLGDWCMIHFVEQGLGQPFTQWSSSSLERIGLHKDLEELCAKISHQSPLPLPQQVNLKTKVFETLSPFQKKLLESGVRSYILLPLSARHRNIGVMALFSEKRDYTDQDTQFTSLIASRAALAIDNARLHKKSRDAINARDEILAIVSHDLKNPIASIQMAAELMLENLQNMAIEPRSTREEIHFLLHTIERSSNQSLYLINDLLDFSQVESGNLKIEVRQNSIADVIEDVAELFMPLAKEKQIHLLTYLTDAEDRVSCDRRRLLQALSNLVGNSLKFTPKGGTILIREEISDGSILIMLEDTGRGIKPEAIEHIFERYWQPTESRKQGSGLGLFITKGIIEAHGGKIWVESELEKGTRFYIKLPQNQSAQRSSASIHHSA